MTSFNREENYAGQDYTLDKEKYLKDTVLQPPPYQPSAYNPVQTQETRDQRFFNIISKYEIRQEYANILQQLQGFKICFIFDDSGSMNTVLSESPLNDNKVGMLKATRWDELQYFAKISIEIASLFNDPNSGTDVYFLNKPPVKNIKDVDQFASYLKKLTPNGYTPLNKTFNIVLGENVNTVKEKKLLVIILTDGEPSDDFGNTDIKSFKRSLQARNPMNKIFVNIVVCTDDEDVVSYLNKWDVKIPNLDVTDDYTSERDQIKKIKGKKYRFSFGDYVVKSMVGSVDPKLDQMDESKCGLL